MNEKLWTIAAPVLTLGLPAASALAQQGAQANGMKPAEGEQPNLLQPDYQSLIWVLVIFIILAVILYRTAWQNVLGGLKAREERIRKDIADAEQTRVKAEALLRDYNQQIADAEQRVRDMLSKAASDGEKLAAQIRAHAQQEAEETRERAVKEIETAREQALSDIYTQTADLATRVAEKILRRNLNADDQRDLVNQSLQELQTVA